MHEMLLLIRVACLQLKAKAILEKDSKGYVLQGLECE